MLIKTKKYPSLPIIMAKKKKCDFQMLGKTNEIESSQLGGHVVWYTTLESKLAKPGEIENVVYAQAVLPLEIIP